MYDIMLQRLFWKEYRTQRGFWLGIAGTGLVLQLIVLMVTDQLDIRINTLFGISLMLPVFYAMGSTAVTFASEKEDQTWERLRILASSPGRLFLAKFGFSVISTLFMAAVLVSLSWGMASGKIPEFRNGASGSRVWLLAAVEFLVWGTFFSLITRRVLSAVCLTPLFALSFAAIASIADAQLWTIRLVMMGFLFVASIGLSRRWLKRENIGWSVPWSISLRRKQAFYHTALDIDAPQKRLFKRLKWQERRQAQNVCFVFLLVGMPLVAVSFWTNREMRIDFAAQLIPLVSLLCGVWVFRGEQEGKRFRYLTECGVTPQTVWLSKQRVWITATLILVFLFVLTDLIAFSFQPNHNQYYNQTDVLSNYQGILNKITQNVGSRNILPVLLLYCFTTYSIGQFVSMLFPRGVTAGFVGFLLSFVLLGWLYLMLWLDVPLLFSVWPIPLTLLWATRVRSADWMLERGGFKPWLRLGTTIVVPAVLIASFTIHRRGVRDMEIGREMLRVKYRNALNPTVWQTRRIFENALTPSTAEERKTADMYRRASELLTGTTMEMYIADPRVKHENNIPSPQLGWDYATPAAKKWLEDNQESLALILEASQRKSCAFLNPATATYGQSFGVFKSHDMYRLLLFSARKLESENKLDEALKHYIASLRLGRHLAQRGGVYAQWNYGWSIQSRTFNWLRLWAGHPQQTKERLKDAIDQIRTETDKFPSPAEAVAIQNGILRRTFIDEPDVLLALSSSSAEEIDDVLKAFLWRFCAWERTRCVELLELLTVDELNYLRQLQVQLDRRGIDIVRWKSKNDVRYSDQTGRLPWSLIPTTPLLAPFVPSHHSNLGLNLIDLKIRRDAILLTLGLIAYRKEHGELPQRLDQLVGEYFDELPLDTWSGRNFGYEPEGFPTAVRFGNHTTNPGEPVFWSGGSAGARLLRVGKTEQNLPKYRMMPADGRNYENIPEERRPGYGRAFPISE